MTDFEKMIQDEEDNFHEDEPIVNCARCQKDIQGSEEVNIVYDNGLELPVCHGCLKFFKPSTEAFPCVVCGKDLLASKVSILYDNGIDHPACSDCGKVF